MITRGYQSYGSEEQRRSQWDDDSDDERDVMRPSKSDEPRTTDMNTVLVINGELNPYAQPESNQPRSNQATAELR